MPTLTQIEPCEPPVLQREQVHGPSTPLDYAILRFLGTQRFPVTLATITAGVESTTHRTHARVRCLLDRGLLQRRPIPGGPRRGPGASEYSLTASVT